MSFPAGFIVPCLPTSAPQPPCGAEWLHEIKHDGFRVIARKDGERLKLYSRAGNDLTQRFPPIIESLARLRARSCIVDGETIPISPQATPRGLELSVDEAKAVTYGHYRRVHRRVYRRAYRRGYYGAPSYYGRRYHY